MISLFENKEECCGCMACYNVCTQGAISIVKDDNGFKYPQINHTKCVQCRACLNICSYKKECTLNYPSACYAAVSRDSQILNKSASGGVFTSVAKLFLENGGIVYGCALNLTKHNSTVKHIRVCSCDQLYLLSGSKYVQSDMKEIYRMVKEDLKAGEKVLFSGTPCQVDAVNSYVGNLSENLVTIDIICHGVPDSGMFFDYLDNLGKNAGNKITDFKFRDKEAGWDLIGSYISEDNNGKPSKKLLSHLESSYYQYFLNGEIYRENCYTCKYADEKRCSDITIGDYWGIEDVHPELLKKNGGNIDEKKGVSCILVNTNKGREIFNRLFEPALLTYQTKYEDIIKTNKQLSHPTIRGSHREKILKRYRKNGYAAVEKYWKATVRMKKRKEKIKSLIKKLWRM